MGSFLSNGALFYVKGLFFISLCLRGLFLKDSLSAGVSAYIGAKVFVIGAGGADSLYKWAGADSLYTPYPLHPTPYTPTPHS